MEPHDNFRPLATSHVASTVPCWLVVLAGFLAGGMSWGIRGQYGHESGAMMAGLLVSLVVCLLLVPSVNMLTVARAVAWTTVAMGFGGSMTYGQTVGLTHDAKFVGNWEAWQWGMFGLAVKGGIWIGFAGAFLGMGLGGKKYSWRTMLMLMFALVALCYLGEQVLNRPYEPTEKRLPAIYFSASWYWQPDNANLKPRPEIWGGLLFSLAGLFAFVAMNRDVLALRMLSFGVLGGALGFPLGQCWQSYHAWNRASFRAGEWATIDPLINWWNLMEITFGAIMGATLALGLWLNRHRIRAEAPAPLPLGSSAVTIAEFLLVALHVFILCWQQFWPGPIANQLYGLGLQMGVIPMVCIAFGRWWPFLLALPITLIPIAGKTCLRLVHEEKTIAPALGWAIYVLVPILVMSVAAFVFYRRSQRGEPAAKYLRPGLLLSAWMIFGLNFAFFHFPWPWLTWTGRTPSGLVFVVCLVGLTALAFLPIRMKSNDAAPANP